MERKPNEDMNAAWERVAESVAHLRGYPPFETFMEAIHLLQRESWLDNCEDIVLRDHAAMTFNSGVVYACERIIQTVNQN